MGDRTWADQVLEDIALYGADLRGEIRNLRSDLTVVRAELEEARALVQRTVYVIEQGTDVKQLYDDSEAFLARATTQEGSDAK